MADLRAVRQRAIREIVAQRAIRTQGELAAALRARGIAVTQATVSRDLRELGARKAPRGGLQAYVLPPGGATEGEAAERLAALLRGTPVEVRTAGTLLVLRTLSGAAHALAAAIDRLRRPEIVGSIAGDDTVFLACADADGPRRVAQALAALRDGPAEGPGGRRRG